MSAAAPALARKEGHRIVTVRLADPAIVLALVSLVFGLLTVFFPAWFQAMVMKGWQSGNLSLEVIGIGLLLDAFLYVRIAYRLSAKPTLVAAACLGCLPVAIVVGLSFLLHSAVASIVAQGLANLEERVREEVLAHTYFELVSAIFLPFLAIRLLQQIRVTKPQK